MPKLFVVDFAGTFVTTKIIEEANRFRALVLQRALPSKREHANPSLLYQVNNGYVEKLTGLTKSMTVSYTDNSLRSQDIPGHVYQNQLSTNLFQIGMYMAAKKHGKKIIEPGLAEQLNRIHDCGYGLAIVSGVRTDIISGVLQIAKVPIAFDYICGQPPVLGQSNYDLLRLLAQQDKIAFGLGDKLDDLESYKAFGAIAIFAAWGHPSGGEERSANYTARKPSDLDEIVKGRRYYYS